MRVDLPAPLAPSNAWISPAFMHRLTSSSAFVPPKCLESPSIVSTGLEESLVVVFPDDVMKVSPATSPVARIDLVPNHLLGVMGVSSRLLPLSSGLRRRLHRQYRNAYSRCARRRIGFLPA